MSLSRSNQSGALRQALLRSFEIHRKERRYFPVSCSFMSFGDIDYFVLMVTGARFNSVLSLNKATSTFFVSLVMRLLA